MLEEIKCKSCGQSEEYVTPLIPEVDLCPYCGADIGQQYQEDLAIYGKWTYDSLREMRRQIVALSAFYLCHYSEPRLGTYDQQRLRDLIDEATTFLETDGLALSEMDYKQAGPAPALQLLRILRDALLPFLSDSEERTLSKQDLNKALEDRRIKHIVESFPD